MSKPPKDLASLVQRDPMFSHDSAGNPITRRAQCECGTRFVQYQLSERFLTIVEKRGGTAMKQIQRDIPDFFVPVHCPKCERVDLGYAARRAEMMRDASEAPHAA